VIKISPEALNYRKKSSQRWQALLARLEGKCNSDDLIKANFVRLLKPIG